MYYFSFRHRASCRHFVLLAGVGAGGTFNVARPLRAHVLNLEYNRKQLASNIQTHVHVDGTIANNHVRLYIYIPIYTDAKPGSQTLRNRYSPTHPVESAVASHVANVTPLPSPFKGRSLSHIQDAAHQPHPSVYLFWYDYKLLQIRSCQHLSFDHKV